MECKIIDIRKSDMFRIKPLWEKLNQIHLQDSNYFKEHYKYFTFEKRIEDFQAIKDSDIKILIVNQGLDDLGYCISTVKNETGEIESIFVEERIRKLGIGKKLIDESVKWLKERDCKKIVVSVADGHDSVIAFYNKLGFFPRLTYLQMK